MLVAPLQVDHEPRPFRAEPAAADLMDLLVNGVLEEMLNSCVLTATASSVANAAMAKHAGCSERMVAQYLPPPPTLFSQSRLKLCTTPRTCSLSILLSCYFDRLVFLRDLTRNKIEQSPEAREDQSFAAVARAWRMLAGDALEALPEFEKLHTRADEERAQRINEIVDFLTRAEAGCWPCVDAYGTVKIPFWAERRASQRRETNLQAFFTVGDSLQRASVIDASRNGLCVLGLQAIWVGARIYLLVAPGRSIGGTIVWCKDGKAGIELDGDLPEDSQLLVHLH